MLEVKYFPDANPQNGNLGGGYLKTEHFSISFKVRTGQYGLWVILPSSKKADGSGFYEHVTFLNNDAKAFITAEVEKAIAAQAQYTPTPRASTTSPSGSSAPQAGPQSIKRQAAPPASQTGSTSGIPSKLPWEQ